LLVQRSTLVRFFETLPARLMPGLWTAPAQAGGTHAAIREIYARRTGVALCAALHLAAWLIATGEAYVALRFLGHALPVADVVALEAFVMALRSVVFVLPAGLGVQEGAYVVIGAALGLPPETALALSLLKRGREVLFGAPGLVIWQIVEARSRAGASVKASHALTPTLSRPRTNDRYAGEAGGRERE
jgi:uncharacterized membrane protein YbhN (UPF0104 family)